MKIIKGKKLCITETKLSPVNAAPNIVHTGCVRLVRLITNNPVPQQVSYTGDKKLG